MRTTAAIAALLTLAAAAPAMADGMTVQIDHSTRVSLPGSAANVFVGNASIADAILVDRRNLVVVGRGYGVTNLLVIDGAGRTILNREIQVSPGNAGRMTLYQGTGSNNFTCSPTCERTPMPGERGPQPFDNYNDPYLSYQKRAQAGSSQASAAGSSSGNDFAAVAAAAAAGAAAGAGR